MGSIKYSVFFGCLLFLSSCMLLDKGYTGENEQYVPKKPNYKLKDLPDCIIQPSNLDTVNIYKLVSREEFGVQIYPNSEATSEISNLISYIKFYSKGRCLEFTTYTKDKSGNPYQLKEIDLNPNSKYYSKAYYCIYTNNNIAIESFIYGTGYGGYIIMNYTLDATGDTLVYKDENTITIYKKEILPINWKKYTVDW